MKARIAQGGFYEGKIVPGKQYEVTSDMAHVHNAAVDSARSGIKIEEGVYTFGFREIKPSDLKFFRHYDRKGRTFDEATGIGFIGNGVGNDDFDTYQKLNKPREFRVPKAPKTDTSQAQGSNGQKKDSFLKKMLKNAANVIPGVNF